MKAGCSYPSPPSFSLTCFLQLPQHEHVGPHTVSWRRWALQEEGRPCCALSITSSGKVLPIASHPGTSSDCSSAKLIQGSWSYSHTVPLAPRLCLWPLCPIGPQGLLPCPPAMPSPCSSTCHLAVAWTFVLLSLLACYTIPLELVLLHFLFLCFGGFAKRSLGQEALPYPASSH